MRYLYQRGTDPRRRRVMHLCGYDPRTGEPTMEPLCGRVRLRFDTTCNVRLGQPVCKYCTAAANAAYQEPQD